MIVIISGPSSVGKSRTIKELCKIDSIYKKIISNTTRNKRKDEVAGVDYDFDSPNEFCEKISQKKFITWKKGQYGFYGLSISRLEDAIRKGFTPVIDMDVDTYIELKRQKYSIISIFLLPDKLETLRQRLSNRGTDRGIMNESDFKMRFYEAVKMLDYIELYDYAIINYNDVETARSLNEIIKVEQIKKDKSRLISNIREDAIAYKLRL